MTTGQIERTDDEAASRALVVIEDIDSALIAQELEGRAVAAWAYSFSDGSAQVSGLTVAGVEQCSRESAKHGEALRIVSTKYDPMEDGAAWFAIVEVGRYAVREDGTAILLDTAVGTKMERARKWSTKRRAWYEDPQALDKAISKAARNAKRKLLDPALQERVLAAALATPGKVVTPGPDRQRAAAREAERESMPPPPKSKISEDAARRAFYQVATEQGLTDAKGKASQAKIHARLQAAIGLPCQPHAVHDGQANDPNACHALREAVERYAAAHDGDKAGAWDELAGFLAATDDGDWENAAEGLPFE